MKVVSSLAVSSITLLCLVSAVSFASDVLAQTRFNLENAAVDPRKNKITICSQNLKNYAGLGGDFVAPKRKNGGGTDEVDPAEASQKEDELIKRFSFVGCDIIAVQELVGATDELAKSAIDRLSGLIRTKTGRRFFSVIGDVNENSQRNAFLLAQDKVELLNTVTYRKVLLPKLDDSQKPRQFSRSPLEIQISAGGKDGGVAKNISLVNIHFKSKSGSKDDPAALQWETQRMEMAEGVRRIMGDRYEHQITSGEPIVVLGDRNANVDAASAKILEGSLTLDDFKNKARCRVTKSGTPLCQIGERRPIQFYSLITNDPQTSKLAGTFVYKKVFSFIDDISVNPSALNFFRTDMDHDGDYDSGIISAGEEASDHAMVYARIRW